MANNRFSPAHQDPRCSPSAPRENEVRRMDDIMIELLSQYDARFPGLHITIIEDSEIDQ